MKQITIWTFIVSCQRWIQYGTFETDDQARDHLRKRGKSEFKRDADGNPIFHIKETDGHPPPLPYRRPVI